MLYIRIEEVIFYNIYSILMINYLFILKEEEIIVLLDNFIEKKVYCVFIMYGMYVFYVGDGLV